MKALLRSDMRAFLEKVFTTLTPGQEYVPNWHIEAIVHHLEQIRRGAIKRLIINMPPRSLKSIASSVAFPAFMLGHDPTKRVICVSYSGELAKKHSNDFRAILESPWYRDLFPASGIGSYKNTETEIELKARGFRLATSIGGTLTGRGGDAIVIDDPLKPDDALSDTKREAANHWFSNTLLSRLDNKSSGAIVVVMQRLHVDDLTGYLLRQGGADWTLLELPALATLDVAIEIGPGRTHQRKEGDVLSPEREPKSILDEMKRSLGSAAFEAQYQQSPAPPGGAMIKRAWIRRFELPPDKSEHLYILQSWDTASKGGPDNDWSVCTTWLICRGTRRYLLDVWRGRVDYPSLKANVIRLAKRHNASKILIEDTGAGISLVQELRTQISGVIAVRPEGDKVARMSVVTAKFEAGQIYLPNSASWLPDLEAELFAFPYGRHDDQCDSISQALSNDKRSFIDNITDEVLAQASIPNPRYRRHYI